MTVRSNQIDGRTIYAGSLDELAALADQYATGRRPIPDGLNAGHLEAVAAGLRAGVRVHDLGPIRFYGDAADGAPFRGPYAPRTKEAHINSISAKPRETTPKER